jgi:hypothetical protein
MKIACALLLVASAFAQDLGFASFAPMGDGLKASLPSMPVARPNFRAKHNASVPVPISAMGANATTGGKEEAKVCIDMAKTVCKEPSKDGKMPGHTVKPSYVGSLSDKTSSVCAGDSCPPETKAALKAYDAQLTKVEHQKNVAEEIKGLIKVYSEKLGEVQKKLGQEQGKLAKAKAAIAASKVLAQAGGVKSKNNKQQQLNNELAGQLQHLKHLSGKVAKVNAREAALKQQKDRVEAQVAQIKAKLSSLKF